MSSWSEMGGRDDTPRGHATYMGGISGTQSLLLIFLKIALRAPQFASPAGQWTSPPLTPTVPILPGALCFCRLWGWGAHVPTHHGHPSSSCSHVTRLCTPSLLHPILALD